jgi:hypothetical protein
MPIQETFLEREVNGRQLQVVKSYDSAFARDAFNHMEPMALDFLKSCLNLQSKYDPTELPLPSDPEFADVVWEEIEEGAREDWNTFSYFVVLLAANGTSQPLYVSPDWPSAEAFCAELEKLTSQNHNAS